MRLCHSSTRISRCGACERLPVSLVALRVVPAVSSTLSKSRGTTWARTPCGFAQKSRVLALVPVVRASASPNSMNGNRATEDFLSRRIIAAGKTDEVLDLLLSTHSERRASRKISGYVSGGLHPHDGGVCSTCQHRTPDSQNRGYGWCKLRNNASVSSTGGCDDHEPNNLKA